jgi:hypothetical protein
MGTYRGSVLLCCKSRLCDLLFWFSFCWIYNPICNQLQFKCDFEQNTFQNHTPAGKVNLWMYVETEKVNTQNQKSALSHLLPESGGRTLQYSGDKTFKLQSCWVFATLKLVCLVDIRRTMSSGVSKYMFLT